MNHLTEETALYRFRSCPESIRRQAAELCDSHDCATFLCEQMLEQQQQHQRHHDEQIDEDDDDDDDNSTPTSSISSRQHAPSSSAAKLCFVQPVKEVLVAPGSGGPGSLHPRSSSHLLPAPSQLASVQRVLNNLDYSFLPLASFFDLRKRRSLRQILETGREIMTASLPIRCLEAVFVGLLLTTGSRTLERIPISLTSEAPIEPSASAAAASSSSLPSSPSSKRRRAAGENDPDDNEERILSRFESVPLDVEGVSEPIKVFNTTMSFNKNGSKQQQHQPDPPQQFVQFKHIVLGISHNTHPTLFGTLGLSRRSCLMDKPLSFVSLADLLDDFRVSYHSVGHSCALFRLGLPVSHDGLSRVMPCWNFVEMILPNRGAPYPSSSGSVDDKRDDDDDDEAAAAAAPTTPSVASGITISSSRAMRRALETYQQLHVELGADYVKFLEAVPEARGCCMRATEHRVRNFMRLPPDARRTLKESDLLAKAILESVAGQLNRAHASGADRCMSRGDVVGLDGEEPESNYFIASTVAAVSAPDEAASSCCAPSPMVAAEDEEKKPAERELEFDQPQPQQQQPDTPTSSSASYQTTNVEDRFARHLGTGFLADHLSVRENLFRVECLMRGVNPFRVAMGINRSSAFTYEKLARHIASRNAGGGGGGGGENRFMSRPPPRGPPPALPVLNAAAAAAAEASPSDEGNTPLAEQSEEVAVPLEQQHQQQRDDQTYSQTPECDADAQEGKDGMGSEADFALDFDDDPKNLDEPAALLQELDAVVEDDGDFE